MKLARKKNQDKHRIMSKNNEQNASFMVRFNQKIFEENGEAKVQWRGKITHVQDGEDKRFTNFNDALVFMQKKLAEVTEHATRHESSEKQDNIIEKSFSMWKTLKDVGPKMLKDTIKDPKKQFANFQEQLQDQMFTIGEEISEKVQIDQWRNASRSDFNQIQNQITELSNQVTTLSKKIDQLNTKK